MSSLNVFSYSELGSKVFMDAHSTVTAEEGDRYPLVPPSFVKVLARERHNSELLRRTDYCRAENRVSTCLRA